MFLSAGHCVVNRTMSANKVMTGPSVDPYKEEKEGKLREIGSQAVWSLSSCKPGMISFKGHSYFYSTLYQ